MNIQRPARLILLIITVIATMAVLCPATAPAQLESTILTQDIRLTLNKFGDGDIEIKQTMNGLQWTTWYKLYGQNPSLIKRNIEYELSAYEISDIKIAVDATNRAYVATMKQKAASMYKGNGIWEIELKKGTTVNKLSNDEWLLNTSDTTGNCILQNNIKVRFPKGAKNISQAIDETGKPIIRYELSYASPLPIFLAVAILFLILAIATATAKFSKVI